MIIDFLDDCYRDVESYPVRSQVKPGYLRKKLPETAPNHSESTETILQDVQNDIIPGITHWQSPNYFFSFYSGGGVLQGTTCEAILCTLTASRDKMLIKIGRENINKLVVYASDQTHCALQKAAQIAGINPKNFRAIATSKATNFGLSP
ncbi:hypothetical protein MKX01_005473 [Papaver californicum]|nr:hypothetical protein MKX01_005473 [Papaver californicum]